MGITRFPHGISAYGVPISPGQGRFDGWWGTTRFVDYDNGLADNAGDTPDTAMKYLQDAIDASSINDVIYVRNREQDITSTDPEYMVPEAGSNYSVAEAQTHLSIIGASNVSHISGVAGPANMAVYVRGNSTATTGPTMDWRGAFGLCENIAWHRGAVTSGGCFKFAGNSTSLRALGGVVANCLFRLDSNSDGAIYNVDNWWVTIYGCTFHDCRKGINFVGSSSTIRRSTIANCIFRNQTATSVDINIHMQGGSTQDVLITDCSFIDNAPNYSGGTNEYIVFTATATGAFIRCNFPTDVSEGDATMTSNGVDMMDCHQALHVDNDEGFGQT